MKKEDRIFEKEILKKLEEKCSTHFPVDNMHKYYFYDEEIENYSFDVTIYTRKHDYHNWKYIIFPHRNFERYSFRENEIDEFYMKLKELKIIGGKDPNIAAIELLANFQRGK